MKLGDFLDLHDIPLGDFATQVGTTKATISRVMHGQVVPRRALMVDIHKATGGAVCPNDLMQLFPPDDTQLPEGTNGSG